MSNLEELIERLCPDGVEYKRLGDIGRISMCKRVLKSQTNSVSGVPFYKIGTFGKEADSYISEELFLDYKSRYPYPKKGDVLISASGTIGRTVIFDGKPSYFQDSNIIWVANNEEFLTNKFLYYIYQTNPWKVADGGTIQRLYNSDLEKIQFPVPPLEVQREIVRILDNFTFLTTELAAELAARQKQYEYYRDLLFLSLKAEYRFIPEFAKTYIGLVTTMTQHYVKEGVKLLFNSSVKENHFDFPKMVYLDNEFAEKNSSRMHKLGDIITVHTGDVGTSAIIDETLEGSLGFATIVTRIYNQEDVLPKYVSYYLNSNENKNNIYKLIKGDRNNLNLKDFNKLRVPIPSLEQQQRIVDILDRFETLCNDISSGLPAEIEARQKQYEYYRDKLLTFKELKKEA